MALFSAMIRMILTGARSNQNTGPLNYQWESGFPLKRWWETQPNSHFDIARISRSYFAGLVGVCGHCRRVNF
jgi:hypothetical protein